MTDLGSTPGRPFSKAYSINASGQAVGEAFVDDGTDTPGLAVLWEDGNPALDLNTFVPPGVDFQLHEAVFISDRGEIAGKALLANGDAHGFLLIPDGHGSSEAVSSITTPGAIAPRAALTPWAATSLLNRLSSRSRDLRSGLKKPAPHR